MKFPAWAPPDLLKVYEEVKPKADAEEARWKAHQDGTNPIPVYDPKEALEQGKLHLGMYFLGDRARLKMLLPLITKKPMEKVWTNLKRRSASFKPAPSFPYGGREQGNNLFGICMETELKWHNLPKRTKAEAKQYYEAVADLALKLGSLLLEDDHNRKLLDTREYITEERIEAFKKALQEDDHEMWYGFDGYLDHLLGDLVQPLPYYLVQLHRRAKEHAELPLAVRQPNSPSARINYYIEHLSKYFTQSYGSPLHGHVATVVSVVLNANVDEDRVRALLRSRKAAVKEYARKKVADFKKNPSG